MTDDTTAGEPAPEAAPGAPEPRRIESAEPEPPAVAEVAAAEPEAAPEGTAGAGPDPDRRRCARCSRVLVGEDETGWYFQAPVTDDRAPGMTFMDRVHECDGKPHDVIPLSGAPEVHEPARELLEPPREPRTLAQIRDGWAESAAITARSFADLGRELDDQVRRCGEALDGIHARYQSRHALALPPGIAA